jgi:WD40 repeat protein/tRNA A-37 threonylcarbamoyl transferase component Bud32
MIDTGETSAMIPSYLTDSLRLGQLEEVLEEYMRRLDRGEVVNRDQFLARHPDLANELRSYFAATDEVEQLRRPQEVETPASPHCVGQPQTCGLEEPPPVSVEGRRVGDYELLEPIGYGGMGIIYKARQIHLQRLVALKMIRPDRLASPADVLRFRSEAEAAASLDHPNIAPIYEVGEHEGEHYFSMKLIEGGSLAEHLPRLAADLPTGVGLLMTVACAVHYAHQRGVLHRDLKPANILLDAEDRPHVTDFGLAKRLGLKSGEASLTQQGMIVGTPSYMAPEQAASQSVVSTAADVYSLGAILYELLTGRPPFRASTPLDTLVQLREEEPIAPRRLNRRVDCELETICLKCLHKESRQRYPSAEALADDLKRWLRGEPILARPVGRCRRAIKWARRRPGLAAMSVLLGFVSLAGIAGVIWQWREAVAGYQQASQFAKAEHETAYARTIGQSYAEWFAGNADPDRLLNECDAESCGWEWHYLRRLFRIRQLGTLYGHADSVLAVAFSNDGSRIASSSADGVVKVWDRHSQREMHTLRGHTAAVKIVAFSPDGRRLASGGDDGYVRVWDVDRGENVLKWCGHAAGVTGLAFDPDGNRLASTGKGDSSLGELKLWDAGKGAALATKTWHTALAAVAFSPDARRLVTAGHDPLSGANVVAWDVATLDPIGGFKAQNKQIVQWTSIAFSADGQWVAAGSPAGLVEVWNGESAQEFPSPTQASVSGVAFSSRDGRIIAAATADNTVRGWFTKSGLSAFTLRGHRGGVTTVACSSDGGCLASGSLDRTVKLWDIRRRDDDLTLRASEGYSSLAFSSASGHLASAPRDNALLIWDVATGKVVSRLRSLPESVNCLAFSADGTQLACAGNDGMVRIREMPGGRETHRLQGHRGSVNAVSYRLDGARLASAGEDGTVRVWEVPSGVEVLCLRGHNGAVHAVAFSPDGGRLASAGKDGVVRVWDAYTGQELLALNDHEGPVYAVAFSLDGRRLSTAGQDGIVRVWDAAAGELLQRLRGHLGAVRGLAYGPGGRLASAGDDRAVRLWDPAGHELLALRGHKDVVRTLAFRLDGHQLASAGDDQMIKVWDGTPEHEANPTQE